MTRKVGTGFRTDHAQTNSSLLTSLKVQPPSPRTSVRGFFSSAIWRNEDGGNMKRARNIASSRRVSFAEWPAREHATMRKLLLIAATAALLGVPSLASAQSYVADVYAPPPVAYGQSPVVGYPPPPAYGYVAPPAYGYVEAPVAAVPAPQVYVAPGTAYADQPIIINGQRYYRDCWWDWGQRRCELKPWW